MKTGTKFLTPIQLFTLSKNYKSSYLVPLEKFNSEIDGKENIAIPLVVDSEFVAPGIETFLNTDNPFQMRRGVTVQVKHALHNDEKIYLHPDFTPDNPRHDPITQPFIVGDYLIQYGYDVEMYRSEYDDKEFSELPSLLVVYYAHFALADLGMSVFDADWINDLTEKYSYKTGGIEMGRRLTCGQSGRASFKWIIKINGFEYRIALKIIDTAALHGIAGYKQVCANSGIELDAKDLIGDYITKMDLAYSEIPEIFDSYALGDLRVYDMLAANAVNMSTVWRDLGVADHTLEPKLTIGATVASLFLAKIYDLFDIEPATTHTRDFKVDEFLEPLTFKASAAYLSTEVNSNAYLLSKCDGGRCKSNNPIITGLKGELVDIDISGAYSSAMSVLDYPFGTPVILATPYNKRKNVGVPLKTVLRAYGGELLPNLWLMRIQVTGLIHDQDFIPSWFDFTRHTTVKTDSSVTGEVDLESGTSKIFTNEIHNGALTSDSLDLIYQCTPRQRDELLEKIEVLAIAFYPKSFELSVADFKNNPLEKTFKSRSFASNGFEMVTQSNHNWCRVPMGLFFTDLMRAKRLQYIKDDPLNALYKLLGNTSYGVSVSRFFNSSNMIVGNNITAKVRAFMYMTEKSLNLCGSVTDGHIFDLNNVLHRKDGLLYTPTLARLYSIPKWQFKKNDCGKFAPLQRSVRTCDYQTEKSAITDLDKENFKNDITEINRAALDHVAAVWNKSPLLHNEFNVLEPVDGRVVYKKAKGVFTFEMKRFADRVTLHGSSNYSFDYNDPENTKMRGYESKNKRHDGYTLIDNELTVTGDYATLSPGQCLMREITNNPAAVKRLPPFVKTAILKPTAFANEYRNKWRKSLLTPGDNILKVGKPSYFSLSLFTYRSHEQFTAFKKANEKLKRKYGESFEMFFTNENDTINYQKMIVEMDKLIRNGVLNPLSVLDPHNHLNRLKSPLAGLYHDTSKALKEQVAFEHVGDDDDFEFSSEFDFDGGFDE